jgi:hypothetical protein
MKNAEEVYRIICTLVLACATAAANSQTPAQLEYERQQREYRQQQERQRQEQQQQQQLMNENARRQQEESRRLNAPTGQSPTPGYQGAASSASPRQPAAQANVNAATAAAKWELAGSHTNQGGFDIYSDRVTMRRSGDLVKLWEMFDYKTPQVIGGQRVLSVQNHYEYDCKAARRRMLTAVGFAGHMGKTVVVDTTGLAPEPWESVAADTYQELLRKVACSKK